MVAFSPSARFSATGAAKHPCRSHCFCTGPPPPICEVCGEDASGENALPITALEIQIIGVGEQCVSFNGLFEVPNTNEFGQCSGSLCIPQTPIQFPCGLAGNLTTAPYWTLEWNIQEFYGGGANRQTNWWVSATQWIESRNNGFEQDICGGEYEFLVSHRNTASGGLNLPDIDRNLICLGEQVGPYPLNVRFAAGFGDPGVIECDQCKDFGDVLIRYVFA